jgi:tetratricopeptide (TPR) repeat protein
LRDRVDEIWAPSNYVRDVYKRSGIATEKIQVIPWGIDPGVFNPQVPPLHLDSASDFRFLFVGGTIRRKGFDTLLAAYTEEFSPDEPVSLVIKDMGTSSFYRIENHAAQIRAAQADASKPKIVYLDDFLSDGQMASLYRACDVLVSPYRGEGFGLPILEGMACGLAPMVTHGGPSDDFVDSDCGIFLESREVPCQAMHEMAGVPTELEVSVDELREKLRWAYENREAVDELGVAAANRAAAHSWSETARLMTERIDVLAGKVRPDVRCSPPPSSSPKEPSADTPIRRRSPQPCLPPSSSPKEPSADTPTISMCMIARESAETIRAALESVRPWVDEMVVVDTGSKDDTAKIANEAGAKVHYFKWIDDFSAARNASIEHASGDWVFWMDSDDTISAENGMKLRELLANTPADDVLGFVMQVHCPPSPDKRAEEKTVVDHVKLFRNRPDLRFERRIHEQILAAIRRAGGQIEWSDVYVEHTGYDHTHEGQTRKRERDFRLLELELADCPGDPFTLFNLGMTHADVGQHQEAIKYLQQSIEAAGPDESHLRKAYALLASSLRSTGRRDEANGTCREGLMKHPSDVELLFQLGVLLYESGQPDEALDAYQQLLEVPAGDEYFSSRDSSLQGYKAHQNMAVIYADLARHKDAETSWWQVVELLPDYTTAWRGLVESLIAQRKCSAALDLARQLSGRDDLAAFSKLLEARVLTEIGRPGEVRKLLERAYIDVADDAELLAWLAQQQFDLDPADALPALGRLVEVAPSDPAAHHNLGIAHLARGESERALAALRRSLELRPDSADTRSQLEQALVAAEKLGSTVQSHPSHPQEEPDAQQAAQSLAPAQTA